MNFDLTPLTNRIGNQSLYKPYYNLKHDPDMTTREQRICGLLAQRAGLRLDISIELMKANLEAFTDQNIFQDLITATQFILINVRFPDKE